MNTPQPNVMTSLGFFMAGKIGGTCQASESYAGRAQGAAAPGRRRQKYGELVLPLAKFFDNEWPLAMALGQNMAVVAAKEHERYFRKG
jgi:hypothetical protein